MRRASAAALRSGRAPWDTPVLPDAPPWLHEFAVSPIKTSTRSTPTSSSSATIWAIATSRLWPMSILPKKALTLPSGRIAIQESSSPGTRAGLADAAACASASPTNDGTLAETMSAPVDFRNSRRERERSMRAFMAASLCERRLRALDRAQDRDVSAAAALEARQRLAELRVRRPGVFLEHGGSGHDPAVDAVAALRHLLLDVRLLERVRLLGRAEAVDGGDALSRRGRYRHDARANRLALQMDRARAALREAATEMRVVQREIVAQGVQERHVRIDVDRDRLAVDDELDRGHDFLLGGTRGLVWVGPRDARGRARILLSRCRDGARCGATRQRCGRSRGGSTIPSHPTPLGDEPCCLPSVSGPARR